MQLSCVLDNSFLLYAGVDANQDQWKGERIPHHRLCWPTWCLGLVPIWQHLMMIQLMVLFIGLEMNLVWCWINPSCHIFIDMDTFLYFCDSSLPDGCKEGHFLKSLIQGSVMFARPLTNTYLCIHFVRHFNITF